MLEICFLLLIQNIEFGISKLLTSTIIISIFRKAPFVSSPENLKGGRFHEHLRDTFAPLVVRYVDLMESSIAQSLHKGFEKERWEIKG